jgi:hypothetical protein
MRNQRVGAIKWITGGLLGLVGLFFNYPQVKEPQFTVGGVMLMVIGVVFILSGLIDFATPNDKPRNPKE